VSDAKDLFQPGTAPPARELSTEVLGDGKRPRTLVATDRVAKYFPVRSGWLART
jgi:hypothetical protein